MKKRVYTQLLSLILVLSMLLSMMPVVFAAGTDGNVVFEKIESPEESTVPRLEMEQPERDASSEPADYEMVRVAIVLEELSTVEKGFKTLDIRENAQAMAYSQSLKQKQETLSERISAQALNGKALDVEWNLTLVANMISATVPYGSIAAIAQVEGVKAVYVEPSYEVPADQSSDSTTPQQATATDMTGTGMAWASGYTGAGTRIAIIDTGTDVAHQSFDVAAWNYAMTQNAETAGMTLEEYKATLDLLDAEEVAGVLAELHVAERLPDVTAEELFYSEKLPFGFNYPDASTDFTHENDGSSEHGSHVAGIAAANRYIPDGDGFVTAIDTVYAVGQAPDAQILTMKVFGSEGTAYASDFVVAIEDALLLGCDAVNMSLGSTSPGYTLYGDEYFDGVFESLSNTDTVVSVSAGNAYYMSAGNTGGVPGYNYVDDPVQHMGGSPGTMANSFTVASVENSGVVTSYLKSGDDVIFYNELLYNNVPMRTLDPDGNGTELEFLAVPLEITMEEYQALDVAGKAVLIGRGGSPLYTYFAEYHSDLAARGATAMVFYNNSAAGININIATSEATIPAITLTLPDAETILASGTADENGVVTGSFTIVGTLAPVDMGYAGYEMSDFSSWGGPGDLSMKPEITAPGGNIWSVNGAPGASEQYELMSGTSMAAPQIAGMSAILSQYIRENNLEKLTGLTQRQLIQSMLMGTAEPMVDPDTGSYYSMLQQGAGLANVSKAMSAASYILVDGQEDGKVKVELGDDPDRVGVYEASFTLNNLTDEAVSYLISGTVLTQDTFEGLANKNNPEATAWYLDFATAELDANVTVAVNGATVEADGSMDNCDFDGDGDVDTDDAQALLDYVTGVRESIYNLEYADLSDDGVVGSYDVYVFLTRYEGQTITVPASGSVQVVVTIALTEEQKAELDEIYVDGAYVQAYISLDAMADAQGVKTSDLSVPVYGYYGGWTDASMYDKYDVIQYAYDVNYELEDPYVFYGYNYLYVYSNRARYDTTFMGNPYVYDAEYLPERNAISFANGNYISGMSFYNIRNVVDSRVVFSNADTGEVYGTVNAGSWLTNYYSVSQGAYYFNDTEFYFRYSGKDASGRDLPEGTRIKVELQMAPEYYLMEDGEVDWDSLGEGASYITELTIDNEEPEATGITYNAESDTITLTVQDNRYVAAVMLQNATGKTTLGAASPNQTTEGVATNVTIDMSQLAGDEFIIVVCDYAENETYYRAYLEGRPEKELTQKFRGYSTTSGWSAFDLGVNADEYIITTEVPVQFRPSAYAEGYVVAGGSNGLYVYEGDDFANPIKINSSSYTTTYAMTFDEQSETMYAIRYRNSNTLYKIDLITGTNTSIGNFYCDGTKTTMRYFTYTEDGLFYGLGNDMNLYSFYIEDGVTEVPMTKIGYVEKMLGGGGPQGMTWDDETDTLYWANDTRLLEIDTETGAPTLVGTLGSGLSGLFIPDYDPAEDPGDHWYDPVDAMTSFKVSSTSLTMLAGESATLTTTYTPWNIADDSVTWTSSDPTVASVENGVVKALSDGTATITAAPNLSPELAATCTVTVTSASVVMSGVLENTEGSSLFTWNIAESNTYTTGAAVDLDGVISAVKDGEGNVWVQENASGYTMNQVDPATGEILQTSPSQEQGLVFSDMTASSEFGGVFSIYNSYLMVPWNPAENNAAGSFAFGSQLSARTGAGRFAGIASAGYYEYEYEDDDGEYWYYDTERLYLLDNAGYLWTLYVKQEDDGSYTCYIDTPVAVTGLEDVNFRTRDGILPDSLIYNAGTRSMTLSHYNGSATEIYLLRPSGSKWSAVCIGTTEDGVVPAALYEASFGAAAGADSVEDGEQNTVDMITSTNERLGSAPAPGGVNAVTIGSEQVEIASAVGGTNRNVFTVNITAQDVAGAETASTNGLMTVEFASDILTLVGIHVNGDVTSINDLNVENGQITFGYAEVNGFAAGDIVATLTFSYVSAESYNTITVTHKEVNDTFPNREEILTLGRPVDVPVVPGPGVPAVPTLPSGSDSKLPFVDVDEDDWFYGDVKFVFEEGLMNGIDGTHFAPNSTLTRGMIVTILHRMEGEPVVEGAGTFSDVAAGAWCSAAVEWAAAYGIVKGYDDGRFGPNDSITREQLATVLYRYAQYKDMDVSVGEDTNILSYNDAFDIAEYAIPAMQWACGEGLINGDNGNLMPKANASRAQVAAIIHRFLVD